MQQRSLTIPAMDGYRLAATLFGPDAPPRAALLIAGGTAIKQRIFSRFATYCSERGIAALTFDYRGVGGSAPATLRGFPARMRDWALLDLPAVAGWLTQTYSDLPLYYAGHSFGGHALGLYPENMRFERSLLIATLSGYWRDFAGVEGYRTYCLMNIFAPAVISVAGYMPGSFGLGESLAAPTFREWANWCRLPNYFFDDPTLPETKHFGAYTGAIRSISFEDDPWTTHRSVQSLLRRYSNAQIEYLRYAPCELGLPNVGHVGFFRPHHRDRLWRESVDWLLSAA